MAGKITEGELHRSLLDAPLKLPGADKIERSTQPASDRPTNVQQSLQMRHQLNSGFLPCTSPCTRTGWSEALVRALRLDWAS